jgi:S1-C subfamily serine protease
MADRLTRIVVVWVLLLATAWVAEPYVTAIWVAERGARTISPRGDLTQVEQTTIRVFNDASPSVVHVYAQTRSPNSIIGEDEDTLVQSGSGSVWDAAGHVVTNYHVIRGMNAIGARLTSGEFVNASIVGVAPSYDLAVLQLKRPRSDLPPIAIGRSDDLQVGQATFAIGNPYGLEQTLTTGIISALHRRLPTATEHEVGGVIQTDAPINPGNSGGPLLDSSGRMIGVNSAIISGSGASAGIGFAIPIDVVARVTTQLIREGHVPVPGIGIVGASESEATRLGIDGVIVVRTLPDSPAANAGLEGAAEAGGIVEDVITAVNGQAVHSMPNLARIFEDAGIGNNVALTVTRNGKSRTVNITVTDISKLEQG